MNIRILPYQPQYQPYFEKLNKAWIEEFFTLEPIDLWVLENPEEAILSKGGAIFFAEYNGLIIGAAALKVNEPGVLELTKMAVDRQHQGLGAGKLLCETAIRKAAEMGAGKLVLYTHSSLYTAIAIYKKLGFREVPVEAGRYARADVKMEIRQPNPLPL
ncbi:gcn5-related N-acetyltransferase [Flammeovirgaceae bacterium 311]|nr:gcn5-related N-acetyltransferase [Flammeovirgaceae bacterium 311]